VAEALQLAASLQQPLGHVTVMGIPVAGEYSNVTDTILDCLYADLQQRLLQKQD
jgi:hypothetical protein